MGATICKEISTEIKIFHNSKLFLRNENRCEYFQCYPIKVYKWLNLNVNQFLAMLNSVSIYVMCQFFSTFAKQFFFNFAYGWVLLLQSGSEWRNSIGVLRTHFKWFTSFPLSMEDAAWVFREPIKIFIQQRIYFLMHLSSSRSYRSLHRDVFHALFQCWCPHFSSSPTQQMNVKQSELRVVRDTSGLPSSDWFRITFIFHNRRVARLWRGQRLVSLEKVKSVLESVTNMWRICDSYVTHLWRIWNTYETMFDQHVTHLWPMLLTHMWFICDPSETYPVTYVWSIFDSYVSHVSLVCDQSVTHPVIHI